jgi:23S rRNA (pseudouridine1915-N3)-methyltransferase
VKITIAAVGQRLPAWAEQATQEYLQRLRGDWSVQLKEIKAEPRPQDLPRVLAAEATRLRTALPPGALLVALDERGKDWTTQRLADALSQWRDAAEHVAFAIGGADGLDPEFKRDARLLLRLSSLTLPHALARVLLAEQLYRAWSILGQHPYHRA